MGVCGVDVGACGVDVGACGVCDNVVVRQLAADPTAGLGRSMETVSDSSVGTASSNTFDDLRGT